MKQKRGDRSNRASCGLVSRLLASGAQRAQAHISHTHSLAVTCSSE